MTLRGNLESFSPSELLQFLAFSKKTGLLKVYDEQESKFVAFDQGSLVYAVHQRSLPHLSELLVHVDSESSPADTTSTKPSGWDDIVTRALARRRLLPHQQSALSRKAIKDLARESKTRLKTLLLAQGRVEPERLREALDPRTVPDPLLEEAIRQQDLVPSRELFECLQSRRNEESVFECVTEQGLLSPIQVEQAIDSASDDLLAEIVISRGLMTRPEVRSCLSQLQSLQGQPNTTVRLGEYLVATGQVSQAQFERALVEQLDHDKRLGEIFVDQGIVTPSEVLSAIEEIEDLRVDFGPLAPLRQKLSESHLVTARDFAEALEAIQEKPRSLSSHFAEQGKVNETDFREAARTVLMEEICDTLIWRHAQFEFIDDVGLCDILPASEFCEVLEDTFTVQQILIDSHRMVDELQRATDEGFSLLSVLIPTEIPKESVTQPNLTPHQRVLRHFDGQKTLQKIRRVLSGNRFSHLRLFCELLGDKMVRPLSRREAYLRGKKSLLSGDHRTAVNLFRHAIRMPGDLPTNQSLQEAILSTRKKQRPRFFLDKILKCFGLVEGEEESGSPTGARPATDTSHADQPGRQAFEEALIKSGLSRFLWVLRHRVNLFFDRFMPRKMALPRATALLMLFLFVTALSLAHFSPLELLVGPTALAQRSAVSQPILTEVLRHGPKALAEVGSPVEVAPLLIDDSVFIASRDGQLRRFDLVEDPETGVSISLAWELPVGRFGDLLSAPTHGEEALFVTNVRGEVSRISLAGKVLWTRSFKSLERIAPLYLPADAETPARLVVAGELELLMLSASEGEIIQKVALKSRVVLPPLGHENWILAGDHEGRVIAWDRTSLEEKWRQRARAPITELRIHGSSVVVHSGANGVKSLELVDGRVNWEGEGAGIPSLVPREPGDTLIALKKRENLVQLGVNDGSEEFRARLSPLISFEKPVRLHDHLYFGTDSGFLARLDLEGKIDWHSPSAIGRITGWTASDRYLIGTTEDGKIVLVEIPRDR